jgi:hypothetical protein
MKRRIEQLAVIVLALGVPYISVGCEPTYSQEVAIAKQHRAIEDSYVLHLFRTSTSVVVGTVTDVHDSSNPKYYQQAVITVGRVLKGPRAKVVTALMARRVRPEPPSSNATALPFVVSCDPPYHPEQKDPYLLKGYQVLVYIKDGVLIRSTTFPVEPQPLWMNAKAEVQFLESHIDNANAGG